MRKEIYFMSISFTKEEMIEMEDILNKFFSDYNLCNTIPVDVFDMASKIGFDVRGTEFRDKLEGLILVDERVDKIEGFNSNKIIAYDCLQDISTKKFIVAHELAHYIEAKANNLKTNIVVAARDHEDEYSNDKNEQRKDYIAAAILVPKSDLIKRFPMKKVVLNEKFYRKISEIYNVEFELAERRAHEVYDG